MAVRLEGEFDSGTIEAAMQLWRDLHQLGEDMGLHTPDDLVMGIMLLAELHSDFAAYEALRHAPKTTPH